MFVIALSGNPLSELQDVSCHIRSHSVTCHPTQVNAPRQVQDSCASFLNMYHPL